MSSSPRLQLTLVVATAVATALSLIGGPRFEDSALLHAPTVVALGALVICARKRAFSDASMYAIIAFLGVHIVASRYTYSKVPYDEWSASLFGVTVSELLGSTRNHFDRLVHFLYGVLMTPPQVEVLRRRMKLGRGAAHTLSCALVLAAGAIYEIAEWGVSVIFGAETADRYNGQQGDLWDAQKDMALAGAGALVATGLAYASSIVRRRIA